MTAEPSITRTAQLRGPGYVSLGALADWAAATAAELGRDAVVRVRGSSPGGDPREGEWFTATASASGAAPSWMEAQA